MSIIYYAAIIIFLIVCFLLCAVILMQEGKGGGLGSSFGGEGGDSLFGTSTADILRKFTGYMAAIFIGFCIVLSVWTMSQGRAEGTKTEYSVEELTD